MKKLEKKEVREILERLLEESKIPEEGLYAISSLDVVSLAVKIEKAFGIKFELDEISEENFKSLDGIEARVSAKLG